MSIPSSIVHRLLEDGWEPDPDQDARDEIISTSPPHEPSRKEAALMAILFARRVLDKADDPRCAQALDVAERYVRHDATNHELSTAVHRIDACKSFTMPYAVEKARTAVYFAVRAAGEFTASAALGMASDAAWFARRSTRENARAELQAQQAIVDAMDVAVDLGEA